MKSSKCPCFSGQPYSVCCEPYHLGKAAPSAETLMRSRYSAYVYQLPQYLCDTWHESTRPSDLTAESLKGTKWLGLSVQAANNIDATHANVSFKAKYKTGKAKTRVLTEKSHFVLESGRWFYVDGEHNNAVFD